MPFSDRSQLVKLFNKRAERRGTKYRVGYTLRDGNPCVLVDGDSVVCEASKHTTNAEQWIVQVAFAMEIAFPEGLW